MKNDKHTENDIDLNLFIKFRYELYRSFPYRADALMDLLDALTSNSGARSPIELSLNALFARKYGSVHDAIHNMAPKDPNLFLAQEMIWIRLMLDCIPAPCSRLFYLLGIDTTAYPRPFAQTLEDRGIQYRPNPTPGNKPIQVGHSYSFVAILPEKDTAKTPPWVVPLSMRRVPTDKKGIQVAVEQMDDLLEDQYLPFQSFLTVNVGDSCYSNPEFINPMSRHPNLVNIVRARGNRKFYRTVQKDNAERSKGHPVWYGDEFHLGDPSSWGSNDASIEHPITFSSGRQAISKIECWHNLLMSGKRELAMHEHPFTLVRVVVTDLSGNPVFKRALWLIVTGKRRHELNLVQVYDSYRQRYDLEHFFRFGKQKLLLTSYQTPEVKNEENWCCLVLPAYFRLYLMSPFAERFPRPWEQYLPNFKIDDYMERATPSIVLRDAERILRQIGTPAKPPLLRGKSEGRVKGCTQEKRRRVPIVFKKNKNCPARSP